MDSKPNKPLAKSYVAHEDRWWFVSTIDRDSSSPYGVRYAETIVWEMPQGIPGERGEQVWTGDGACEGSLHEHCRIVQAIAAKGAAAFEEESSDDK